MARDVRLLLIEDNEVDTSFFRSIVIQINSLKISVHAEEDLDLGLKALRNQKFDIIISDLSLPDASGTEAIEKLSAACGEVPILVLSGSEDDDLLEKSANLGVYDYLYKKDLNPRYLKRSIRYTLSKVEMELQYKHLQEQLNHAHKMEAIGQLTGGIAHDFNNKLAIIKCNVELLPILFVQEQSPKKCIESIERCVTQSAQLTAQLLAFSRKQNIQKIRVKVNDAIRGSLDLLETIANQSLSIGFTEGTDLSDIEADSTQIDQIIMNLVINARDAMESNGRIDIRAFNKSVDQNEAIELGLESSGDYVVIEVEDNGPGIPADIQQKIFEPFYTTKQLGKGTGLGLSVVHGIVSQHGGIMKLESEPNKGAKFSMYFKALPAPETSKASADEIHTTSKPKCTILYAEDEDELRSLTADRFRFHGHTVYEASNGYEAFFLYQAHREDIQVIVSDIRMPKMGGKEPFDEVRKHDPTVPFLFVSGYSQQEIGRTGQMPENTHYIKKPFSVNDLIDYIDSCLEERVSIKKAG